MNKNQDSKLQAWILLRILCNANNLIWQVLAAFVTAFGLFSARLDTLIANATLQQELLNGYARQKQLSKFNMAKLANSIRSKIQAYAATIDDGDVLYAKVNYTLSKLMTMSAPKSLAACKIIYKYADENRVALIPFGVSDDDIEILNEHNTIFTQQMVMPRQAIDQLKGLTARIKEDVSYIENIINKRLSKLIVNFQDSAPIFYTDFFNCKRPVPYATSHTEFDILTKNKVSGEVINGVRVTVIGSTKTYTGKTDIEGQLDLKKISPELYDLIFEIPGYQPVTLSDQKASPGKHAQIVVELMPEN